MQRGRGSCAALARRFEALPESLRIEDMLLGWIRAGAEAFGAVGGVAELRLCEEPRRMVRVHEGVEGSLAESVLGLARGARNPLQRGSDLEESLVAPLLEAEGIASVVALPLATDSLGQVGSIRYLLRVPPDDPDAMRSMIATLSRRLRGKLEARLLTERFRAVSGRLEQILEGAAEAILDLDAAGVVVCANPHAAHMFGLSPQGLRGLSVGRILPDWNSACAASVGCCAHCPWREIEGVRADGSVFAVEVVAASTRVGGWTLFAHDASQRRKREAAGRQSERVASVATLASGLGHDLNNTLLPARAHLNALQRALEGEACAPLGRHIAAIRDGLGYLQRLADALHFLATDPDHAAAGAPVAHAYPDDPPPTSLHGWWGEAGLLLRGAVVPCATLEASIPEDLPPVAMRPDALTRVALNLLTNAVESMPRGRDRSLARVRISARATKGAGSVVLEIADNGSGMPPEVERRLFDPFFTTKIRGLGSGLGLPIARRLVEAARGGISVETEPGKGTVVRIELPAVGLSLRHGPSDPLPGRVPGEAGVTLHQEAESKEY